MYAYTHKYIHVCNRESKKKVDLLEGVLEAFKGQHLLEAKVGERNRKCEVALLQNSKNIMFFFGRKSQGHVSL